MTNEATPGTVAVVGVDFFAAEPMRPVTAALALLLFAPKAEMHLLNVRSVPAGPTGPVDPGEVENRVLDDIDRELAALDDLGASATLGTEIRSVSHVRVGDEAREIIALAERVKADFILIGEHQPGGAKYLLHGRENVEADVRRAARCPVFVVLRANVMPLANDLNLRDRPHA